MADRYFYKTQAMQREIKMLTMEVAIGSTGAPTINATASKGITSITRAAAGDYDVILEDPYNEIVNIHATLFDAASEDIVFQLAVRDADATGGGTFSFFANTAATATELSDGSTILMTIFVRNVAV